MECHQYVSSKCVLILGRFAIEERKAILDALGINLVKIAYCL